MPNHDPIITSPTVNDSFSETANTTGSTTLHQLSGTMNFKDSDKTDTHTTSAALTQAVVSGGTAIPGASLTDLQAALTSTIASDSTAPASSTGRSARRMTTSTSSPKGRR